MEFKFDPHDRRLRIRTLIPAGHEPRVFAPDQLFQFGIEEEYFLSDSKTFAAPAETPDALFQVADTYATGRIGREFLQAQIEVATEPHLSFDEARRELMRLRQGAAAAAGRRARLFLRRLCDWYVQNASFWLDLRIAIYTTIFVFTGERRFEHAVQEAKLLHHTNGHANAPAERKHAEIRGITAARQASATLPISARARAAQSSRAMNRID